MGTLLPCLGKTAAASASAHSDPLDLLDPILCTVGLGRDPGTFYPPACSVALGRRIVRAPGSVCCLACGASGMLIHVFIQAPNEKIRGGPHPLQGQKKRKRTFHPETNEGSMFGLVLWVFFGHGTEPER